MTADGFDEFRSALEREGLRLPLREGADCQVFDADGYLIFTMHGRYDRNSAPIQRAAGWIVLAVNTCAGFKARLDGEAHNAMPEGRA